MAMEAARDLLWPACKLIYDVTQLAGTASQNKVECDNLVGRLSVMNKLLLRQQLEGPEAAELLDGLCATLKEAHELVEVCNKRSAPLKIAFSGDQAERFRDVNSKINSHINLIQWYCQADTAETTRRLDQTARCLDQKINLVLCCEAENTRRLDQITRRLDQQNNLVAENTHRLDQQINLVAENTHRLDQTTCRLDQQINLVAENTHRLDQTTRRLDQKINLVAATGSYSSSRSQQLVAENTRRLDQIIPPDRTNVLLPPAKTMVAAADYESVYSTIVDSSGGIILIRAARV